MAVSGSLGQARGGRWAHIQLAVCSRIRVAGWRARERDGWFLLVVGVRCCSTEGPGGIRRRGRTSPRRGGGVARDAGSKVWRELGAAPNGGRLRHVGHGADNDQVMKQLLISHRHGNYTTRRRDASNTIAATYYVAVRAPRSLCSLQRSLSARRWPCKQRPGGWSRTCNPRHEAARIASGHCMCATARPAGGIWICEPPRASYELASVARS